MPAFFHQIEQFIDAEFRRSILRLEALLLQQLHQHRAGQFVALGTGWEAINAAGGCGNIRGDGALVRVV